VKPLLPAFFLLLFGCLGPASHPSDAEVAQQLAARRGTFESLLRMIREEPRVSRVAYDFIWIDGIQNVPAAEVERYLPAARYAEYRRLFDALELESGVVRRRDGSVGFVRSSSGMVTSGSSKELLWSERPDVPVLADSDRRSLEEACQPRSGCSSARRLAPDWYLTFESD
jgi:hypothetical protein